MCHKTLTLTTELHEPKILLEARVELATKGSLAQIGSHLFYQKQALELTFLCYINNFTKYGAEPTSKIITTQPKHPTYIIGKSTTSEHSPAISCILTMSHPPEEKRVYTIGIAGGSGAGKSTLAQQLYQALGGAAQVTYLVHDSYYRDQSHKSLAERSQTNFDHPDALETELMVQHIRSLKAGQRVAVPAYDFATHTRAPESAAAVWAEPRPILLVEGILILCHPELVKEMDLKVFVVCVFILLW